VTLSRPLFVALAALALAGCGGGSPSPSSPSRPRTLGSPRAFRGSILLGSPTATSIRASVLSRTRAGRSHSSTARPPAPTTGRPRPPRSRPGNRWCWRSTGCAPTRATTTGCRSRRRPAGPPRPTSTPSTPRDPPGPRSRSPSRPTPTSTRTPTSSSTAGRSPTSGPTRPTSTWTSGHVHVREELRGPQRDVQAPDGPGRGGRALRVREGQLRPRHPLVAAVFS